MIADISYLKRRNKIDIISYDSFIKNSNNALLFIDVPKYLREEKRFDFNFDRKLLPEELKKLEDIVNQAIADEVEITCEEMPLEKARESGALGVFGNKYGDVVKVYTMGKYSKEICGGPHAKNTKELHHFKIVKEESSSSGVRRIKAILD